MKNFLIVVPQFVYAGEFYNFPLGLGYISSYLKKKGFNVFCLNLCHFDKCIPLENILREHITKNNIDILCTGTLSWYWDKVDKILKIAKKIKPNIITVVGGAIVVSDPDLALKNLDIDIGIIGEGEETMAELAETLCQKSSIEKIKGITFVKNNLLIITPARARIENLDALPFPDYEGLEFEKWTELMRYSGNFEILDQVGRDGKLRYAEILGSRSCPFSCTFCYHHLGQRYTQRSLDNIFEEMDYLMEKYHVNFFNFLDELFSVNHQRMLEFAKRIKNYNIGWGGGFRVNDVDKQVLETLKKSGLEYMGYGIENINDEILVSMNKKITRAEIESALKITREAGIHYSGNLIFGDPKETEKTAKNSIKWILGNPQYNVAITFLKVIPNSPVYQFALKNNLIKNKLDHIKNRFPLINLTKISNRKFFKFYSQLSWIRRSKRQLRWGKIIESKKIENLGSEKTKKMYAIKVACPFCQHISQYKIYVKNSLIVDFNCEHCTSQNKALGTKAFLKDYDFFISYLNYFSLFLSEYLIRFSFFRKYKNQIIPYLLSIKKFFRLLLQFLSFNRK